MLTVDYPCACTVGHDSRVGHGLLCLVNGNHSGNNSLPVGFGLSLAPNKFDIEIILLSFRRCGRLEFNFDYETPQTMFLF